MAPLTVHASPFTLSPTMPTSLESQSKFLSLVLRHQPQTIGLSLDAQGWADIESLIALANAKGQAFSRERIGEIVATSDKKRFAIDATGMRIRANQGHSLGVDLQLEPKQPPSTLFHGTASRFVPSILAQGLQPQSRQHVHLSITHETANTVGARHGKPVVLTIEAQRMHQLGHVFYCSDNGVWLTDCVPAQFIEQPAPEQ